MKHNKEKIAEEVNKHMKKKIEAVNRGKPSDKNKAKDMRARTTPSIRVGRLQIKARIQKFSRAYRA